MVQGANQSGALRQGEPRHEERPRLFRVQLPSTLEAVPIRKAWARGSKGGEGLEGDPGSTANDKAVTCGIENWKQERA